MPLRRTKRSDGRQRPRWKDGSHANVENTDADPSRCDGLAFEANTLSEPLERVQSLLGLNYELKVSTRDRPARTGADARIEGSGAKGEVRLALRPYGRAFKLRSGSMSEYGALCHVRYGPGTSFTEVRAHPLHIFASGDLTGLQVPAARARRGLT